MNNNKKNEKEYFNKDVEEGTRNSINSIYSKKIVGDINQRYNDILIKDCKNKNYLEIGCGVSDTPVQLSLRGANVFGIDISDKSIEISEEHAKKLGAKITYKVMDAEDLDFPDNNFDVVFGGAILHHLNLDKSIKEICRVVKPGGKAVFIEPLGHNPFINLFRKLTPGYRTTDEHPLKKKELLMISEKFKVSQMQFFFCVSVAAILFKNTVLFNPLFGLLKAVDRALFKIIPAMKYLSWQVLIVVQDKK